MSDRAEDKCGGSVATDSRPAADNQPGETNIEVRFFSSECHDCCNHTDNKTPQFLRFFVTRKLGCTIKLSFPTVLYMCGVTNRKLKEKPPEWSFMDPAEEYKMGNKRRGLALIFNQERFFWRLGLPDRSGTNADRYNLEKRLLDLNFEVRSYDNYKLEEVLEKIAGAAEEDHSDADCFLLAFLSHGEDNHVYCHDGKISIQDITAMFKGDKCKDLAGKPKIFVIQACRGEKHDDPVTPADTVDSRVEVFVDASAVHTLPAGADFIMCYSVAEGYYSHRETINGSWYIQDLCEMLQQYGSSLEFTELLTLVNRKVSTRSVFRCRDPLAIGKKQIPCFASMLTKKLYFRPKK